MHTWQVREPAGSVMFCTACLLALSFVFPPPAAAMEVGCFCTFVFVSTMFTIGVCMTMLVKHLIGRKIWALSKKRTVMITFLEVVLMIGILFILQTRFYLRVLAYLPLAFALNFAMTTAGTPSPAGRTPKKRAAMAALSCIVLPLAVQIMAFVAMYLSDLITFKEVHV